MSVLDIAALTAPVTAEKPAGEPLDMEVGLLEKAATPIPPQIMGNETKPGRDPAWKEVKATALELAKRTRDLRVAMILAAALLKEDGPAAWVEGVRVVAGITTGLWPNLYPALDPDYDNDPTARVNTLKGFDGNGGERDIYKFEKRLREMPLASSKGLGKFSLRDIQMAKGEAPAPKDPEGNPMKTADLGAIKAAFSDTPVPELEALVKNLEEAKKEFEALDKSLMEKLPSGMGVDFSRMTGIIKQIIGAIREYSAAGAGAAPLVEGESAAAPGGGVVPIAGTIASRADVIRMLEKICDYYKRYEPGSVVPIFIRRAQTLVDKDFMEVIKDMAPEAVPRMEIFTGAPAAPPAA